MGLPFKFDWKNPDYREVYAYRAHNLERIRADKTGATLANLEVYYSRNIAQFITDWCVTVDPRNVGKKDAQGNRMLTKMPFILFPKQEELVEWILEGVHSGEGGLIEKSRDEGVSWIVIAVGVALCRFNGGVKVGYGSRKEDYVDRIGDPKSLFWKARELLSNLPPEFRGGWERDKHSPFMRMTFPNTGSSMTGEAGDSIGRGDRTSVYFVDEAAHLERPEMVDMSLASTTECRIDLSSVNGRSNPFAMKRFSGRTRIFTFHWRDDPRKDDAWYKKQCDTLDPVVVAQEIDIDYMASVQNVIIPAQWLSACVDAHTRLGIKVTGEKFSALDIADEGLDTNAQCMGYGVLIEEMYEWTGKGSDIYATTERAFGNCDEYGTRVLRYDGDGIGASVRGDARKINAERVKTLGRDSVIQVEQYRGSGEVLSPNKMAEGTDRTNADYFRNRKAQAWWHARQRVYKTFKWVTEGIVCDPDEIISIAPNCLLREKLINELSQATFSKNDAGKILVNKTPDGSKSPNLGDAVVMWLSGKSKSGLNISGKMLAAMSGSGTTNQMASMIQRMQMGKR